MTSQGALTRTLLAGLGAATTTRLTRTLLGSVTSAERWTRTNHRGAPISLLEGPSVAAGLVVGALLGGSSARTSAAGALAAASGAAFGLVDDLSEDTSRTRKGLRGHLGALAHGELTTGGLKVLGIGAGSLLAAAVAIPRTTGSSRAVWAVDVATAGALVAGSANLVNLFDLRPGRALKAGSLAVLPALASGVSAPTAAACLGAAAAGIGPDLAEQDMLGDGGANALGALAGAAALGAPRAVRLGLLAAVVALTVASERISFTEVIARTPVLSRIDGWGRR